MRENLDSGENIVRWPACRRLLSVSLFRALKREANEMKDVGTQASFKHLILQEERLKNLAIKGIKVPVKQHFLLRVI